MSTGGDVEDGAVADPGEDIGTSKQDIASRWKMELEAARRGPYKRWLTRAKKAIKRYRDEDMDNDEAGLVKRNAQFNVLWSNVQTVAPSIYSKPPSPIAERRYLDRDVIGRAAAAILQRVLSDQIEASELHETMRQVRTDFMLVGIGNSWLRYEATYKKTAPAHQADDPSVEAAADAEKQEGDEYGDDPETQKICVDYCHWSDELFGPARYWQELPWRAKRAYYTRKQLIKRFGEEPGRQVPLKVTRGKKQNDVLTEQVKEAIGKAEVWQIWDFEDHKIYYISEDYPEVLDVKEDSLRLGCFVPSARPARGTITNDTIYPIPDYSIWHDQAAELDSLTARIAALTRAIKAVGAYDASIPELERMLNEGMENKLVGVKNWAKLTQKGGLPGAVSLLPIKELSDALTALYLARAQVKNDLYEISGVSDIVRGASDPNETAAAQKMKGQFSSVRGGDRKGEFDRYVRDTLNIMAELAVEHFTADTIWLMSDFEQWAKDQDLQAYFPDKPMMGHNGGPPLDMAGPPMQQPYPSPAGAGRYPGTSTPEMGAAAPMPAAPPMPQMGGGDLPAGSPAQGQVPPSGAPMASSPGIPPVQGIPMPGAPAPMPQGNPQAYNPVLARQLFDEALKLLREDKLRSFRIQVETNSTIEPDATQEQNARVEFLTVVTQFLAQASDMGAAYPQLMPVLGKFLLFGARGFKVGRDLESSLEGMIGDLEKQARNPQPKKPTPEEMKAEAIKAKAEADKELAGIKQQGEQAKLQMEMQKLVAELQAEQQRLQMEMQKLQMELQAEREKLQIKREEGQIKLQTAQQAGAIKMQQGEQQLALSAQEGQIQAQNTERQGQLEAEGMERQAAHDERTLDRKEQHDEKTIKLKERQQAQKGDANGRGKAG